MELSEPPRDREWLRGRFRLRSLMHVQVTCPRCSQLIGGSDVNVATDVARCARCDQVFVLSALVQAGSSGPANLDDPPRGAWYRSEFDGFEVGATTRSPIAFFLVPFVCVWSGLSIGVLYGLQVIHQRFDLYQSLFGIPFVLSTLFLGAVALMTVCGKVVVRVSDAGGIVFSGVGRIGWSRTFTPWEVTSVRVERYPSGNNQQPLTILLDGPHKLRFASQLTEVRRDFLANVLRQELPARKGPGPYAARDWS